MLEDRNNTIIFLWEIYSIFYANISYSFNPPTLPPCTHPIFYDKMLREKNALMSRCKNLRWGLFCASALWTVFIIIYISCEKFYKSNTAKEIRNHSTNYVEESRSQPVANASMDRLQPLKLMFANASKEDREKGNGSVYWNSIQIPLTDLRDERSKLQVLLVVIVSSATQRQERRDAIRNTWWSKCTGKVWHFVYSVRSTFLV